MPSFIIVVPLLFISMLVLIYFIQIPLGILPYNEVKTDEMIKILDNLHQYIPKQPKKFQQVAFGGDALTAIRARQGINVRVNSTDTETALRGIVPFSADWHAKVNFISVSQ